uniref:Putative thiosulfate sulfurtransferase mpst-4 n=1 Tax=Caenorhabditis elegans TaxID=6239 RepID=THT1_CAEEL|nr:RecName: Full=Putative thiosulfate sulfurtransferase mpst-4; AltName: Full=Mercaptopyruvate sulfurtransferase homolog 4 [Caenorhabditis elegans]
MAVDMIVEPKWVVQNFGNIRILDASWTFKPKADVAEYKAKYYNKFGVGMNELKNPEYLAEHINGAAHFNFDIAYYPSEDERFTLYTPEEFSSYVKRLGVFNGDHLVIYGRGKDGGMAAASRAYWTFRYYGYTTVSVLNGGIEAFKLAQGVVQSDSKAEGIRCKDAIHFPIGEVCAAKGFKKKTDCDQAFAAKGIKVGDTVVISCGIGLSASAICLAAARSGIVAKLYNGGVHELAYKAPQHLNMRVTLLLHAITVLRCTYIHFTFLYAIVIKIERIV